jgi:serine protease Do
MKQEHTKTPKYSPEQPALSQPKRRRLFGYILLIFLCLAAGVGGSALYDKYNDNATVLTSPAFDGNTIVSQDEEDIATVAARVSPSVVSILTKSQTASPDYYAIQEQSGAGTGIIISKDGYILTNNHVIDGADTVTVVSADGTTYEKVKVIGRDPLNDVAFLKIDGVKDLAAATLGDSKSIRIGQKVIAIGNALGQYQNTVTSGIVSGTGRSVVASIDGSQSGAEELSDLIQTDAAINSGNSGGPLVNMAGQVVGINTAIAQDANNVGFVIPISSTKGVIASVLASGKVERPYIGVRYLSITPEVAKEYNLSVRQGAYVSSDKGSAVQQDGPAAKAGIKDRDIIAKVNGVEVGTKGSVSTLLGEYRVGDTVELTILRDGKTISVKVTLTAYTS